MPTLHILVGIPGSGKSTWANEFHAIHKNSVILESDNIRKDIFGDLKHQSKNNHAKVFQVMEKQLIDNMKHGIENIIYDATNIKRKNRKNIYLIGKKYGYNVSVLIFSISYKKALDINNNRDPLKRVPEYKIMEMYKTMQIPKIGLDCDTYTFETSDIININEEIIGADFNKSHNSPYHKESIFEHISMCVANTKKLYIEDYNFNDLHTIALYHDIGKPFCRIKNNDISPRVVWYRENFGEYDRFDNHEYVSSMYYLSLVTPEKFVVTTNNIIAESIFHHMQAHRGISEKYINKHKITKDELTLINEFARIDSMSKIVDKEMLEKFQNIKNKL